MSEQVKSQKLLENAKKIVESEGNNISKDLSPLEKISKYLIPAMENSKDTLEVLYDYKPREKSGFVGKLKNKILNKIKNVTLSTIEKQAIRQQKYNDLVFQAIENLKKEIEDIKK
jgi:hypothetical protein